MKNFQFKSIPIINSHEDTRKVLAELVADLNRHLISTNITSNTTINNGGTSTGGQMLFPLPALPSAVSAQDNPLSRKRNSGGDLITKISVTPTVPIRNSIEWYDVWLHKPAFTEGDGFAYIGRFATGVDIVFWESVPTATENWTVRVTTGNSVCTNKPSDGIVSPAFEVTSYATPLQGDITDAEVDEVHSYRDSDGVALWGCTLHFTLNDTPTAFYANLTVQWYDTTTNLPTHEMQLVGADVGPGVKLYNIEHWGVLPNTKFRMRIYADGRHAPGYIESGVPDASWVLMNCWPGGASYYDITPDVPAGVALNPTTVVGADHPLERKQNPNGDLLTPIYVTVTLPSPSYADYMDVYLHKPSFTEGDGYAWVGRWTVGQTPVFWESTPGSSENWKVRVSTGNSSMDNDPSTGTISAEFTVTSYSTPQAGDITGAAVDEVFSYRDKDGVALWGAKLHFTLNDTISAFYANLTVQQYYVDTGLPAKGQQLVGADVGAGTKVYNIDHWGVLDNIKFRFRIYADGRHAIGFDEGTDIPYTGSEPWVLMSCWPSGASYYDVTPSVPSGGIIATVEVGDGLVAGPPVSVNLGSELEFDGSGHIIISGLSAEKISDFSSQFAWNGSSGVEEITNLNASVVKTGYLQVGGGGDKVSQIKVFNTASTPALIGFIGDDTGGTGYVGAWFKRCAIGGTDPTNAPILAAADGTVAISDASLVVNGSTYTIELNPTTGFKSIYSTDYLQITGATMDISGANISLAISGGGFDMTDTANHRRTVVDTDDGFLIENISTLIHTDVVRIAAATGDADFLGQVAAASFVENGSALGSRYIPTGSAFNDLYLSGSIGTSGGQVAPGTHVHVGVMGDWSVNGNLKLGGAVLTTNYTAETFGLGTVTSSWWLPIYTLAGSFVGKIPIF